MIMLHYYWFQRCLIFDVCRTQGKTVYRASPAPSTPFSLISGGRAAREAQNQGKRCTGRAPIIGLWVLFHDYVAL